MDGGAASSSFVRRGKGATTQTKLMIVNDGGVVRASSAVRRIYSELRAGRGRALKVVAFCKWFTATCYFESLGINRGC